MNGLVRVRCRFCSKPRDPREFLVSSVEGYCWTCAQWAQSEFDRLADNMPHGCVVCERTLEQLAETQPGDNVRLFLHPIDGRWGPMCPSCSDAYEAKRSDLYGGTPYGFSKGLHIKT